MNQKVVNIFTLDGKIKPWKRLSGRVPEFLERYPIADGWRCERQVVEACSLTPLLVDLHKAAIVAGKTPAEVGLSPLPRGLVFIATLVDPNGRFVASGSATTQAESMFAPGSASYKDYEAGESAAFQRLLAAVGFGGEVFDEDEDETIRDMGGKPLDPTAGPAPAKDESSEGSETGATVVELKRSTSTGPAPAPIHDEGELPPVESPEEALAGLNLGTGPSADDGVRASVDAAAEDLADPLDAPSASVEATDAVGKSSTATVSPPKATAKASTPTDVRVTAHGRAPGDQQILAALNRSAKLIADQAGVPFVPATSVADAKAMTAELLRKLQK